MRIHFILLLSFIMPLSGLLKAQVKPANGQMFLMAAASIEFIRRASENFRTSNSLIFGPALNNALRFLSHAARHETQAEIDALGIHPQPEENEILFPPTRHGTVDYDGRTLVAYGQDIQIDNRFRGTVIDEVNPVYWRRNNLEIPDAAEYVYRNFNSVLDCYYSVNEMPPFIDRNTLALADNSFLQIISAARIERPLAEAFHSHHQELAAVSATTPADMQALESEYQRDSRASNFQIASHLDFTEPLRRLMPTAFSSEADFERLLPEHQATLRRVFQDNYFRIRGDTARLTSITRFTFRASLIPFWDRLNAPRRPERRHRRNLAAQPPSDVLPFLYGSHRSNPRWIASDHEINLMEDGSFSMVRAGRSLDIALQVSGIWELVPCDNPSQYRIHFSNIQNNFPYLRNHPFEDISVNFNLVDTVTVLDSEDSFRAGVTGEQGIYIFPSSIVFEQSPIEMVYQQYPHAQPDNVNSAKRTFYPSSGQVKGYCKLPPKDEGN